VSIHRPTTADARRVRRNGPERLIRAALETTRAAVESVPTAANHLNALILQHRVILVPEAAIVRESAALLQQGDSGGGGGRGEHNSLVAEPESLLVGRCDLVRLR